MIDGEADFTACIPDLRTLFSLSNEQSPRGSDFKRVTLGLFALELAKPHSTRSLHLRDVTASGSALGLAFFGMDGLL